MSSSPTTAKRRGSAPNASARSARPVPPVGSHLRVARASISIRRLVHRGSNPVVCLRVVTIRDNGRTIVKAEVSAAIWADAYRAFDARLQSKLRAVRVEIVRVRARIAAGLASTGKVGA